MSEIHFDVNLISRITFTQVRKADRYLWRPEQVIPKYRKRLLIFKVKDGVTIKPEGFYEERHFTHITEEYLFMCGYQIRHSPIANGGKEAWHRASVEVRLIDKSEINRRFDTNEEALDWIEKLKTWSNKPFETITIS